MKIEKSKKENSGKKITEITLDVFGFSRGAAAARNFVHEVNVKRSYIAPGYITHKMKQDHDREQQEKYMQEKEWQAKGGIRVAQDELKPVPIILVDTPVLDSDGEKVLLGKLKKGMLPSKGHLGYMLLLNGFSFEEVEALNINIRFIGVYDTVSSYYKGASTKNFVIDQLTGSGEGNKYFADDVAELELKNLGMLQKAVHFTAMDEHRYNFALTRFPVAGNKSSSNFVEKDFPGVHCDIGGAYLNGTETVDKIEVGFVPSDIPSRRRKQIEQYLFKKGYWGQDAKEKLLAYAYSLVEECWYRKEQLFINDINTFNVYGTAVPFPPGWNGLFDKLGGTRQLRKEYSYIPLLFMEEYFINTLGAGYKKFIPDKEKFEAAFSVANIAVLKKAKEHLRPYVMEGKGKPWSFISAEHIKLKNEIVEKKKKRQADKVKETPKTNKYGYYEPQKKDGYLAEVDRQADKRKTYYDWQYDRIEERQTKMLYAQGILEILRNEYFHWSANKDWFGMNPTESRKRKTY